MIVQRAMTPGTLQIIRSPPQKHRTVGARKRMNLLSDVKEAARTAYSKAKEAINALKEKLRGIAAAHKGKTEVEQKSNETNDKGTNKKSVLAENNEMRGQSLGHVNAEMTLGGMIKKAEKQDLAKISQHVGTIEVPKQLAATSLVKDDKGKLGGKNAANGNEKVANEAFHEILSGSKGNVKAAETQMKEARPGPMTSISSLMDSLAGEEDGVGTNNTSSGTNNTVKPVNEEENKNPSNGNAGHINPLYVGASERKENTTHPHEVKGIEMRNQTNATVGSTNGTANDTRAGSKTEESLAVQGSKAVKVVLMSSHTTEQKFVQVSNTPLTSQVGNATTPQYENVTFSKAKSNTTSGSKRFQLNDIKIQEQVVKTIDRQLETLKRLQEAKRARKRYDKAKHELQDKIKKLYDMAVSFEKPINDALMSTKTIIDSNPTTGNHPGAALAGISDKPAKVVKTPSDDSEHHGFTLGAMDNNALGKAHIVDLDEEREKPVEKMYEVELEKGKAGTAGNSETGDRALKSLTEAIKSDLTKIELNQMEQAKTKKHSEDIKQALEPLISEIGTVAGASKVAADKSEKSVEKAAPQTALQALGEKKDKGAMSSSSDEAASKAQDAFKEVEDYLSKALKHVAKEAISEDESSSKEAEAKESSGIVNEDSKEPSGSEKGAQLPSERVQVTNPTKSANGNSADQGTEDKDSKKNGDANDEKKEDTKDKDKGKEKDIDKNERLRKIVEEAMKEHAKDPKNPHPINADLLKPTSNVKAEASKTQPADSSKKDDKKQAEQKSNPTTVASPSTSADGTIQRSPNDAIGKAEHLEEQVAQLQDKLYSQGTQNDAYKTIDNVEQKPLFSQDANPEEQQPTYQDHVHHHSHRRHHRPYEDEEEDDERGGYSRDGYDRDYDDDDDDDDDYDDEDQREDYDDEDEEDRKRKKSFLQPYSWRPAQYRKYQRDRIYNKKITKSSPAAPKPLMSEGMMGNEERDELEDMKKSTVPKLTERKRNEGIIMRGNKMYIL